MFGIMLRLIMASIGFILTIGAAGPVHAAGVAIFLVNFSQRTSADFVERLVSEQGRSRDAVLIVDTTGPEIVGYYVAGDPVFGKFSQDIAMIPERFREYQRSGGVNLARTLDVVSDVLTRFSDAAGGVDVFLVESMFHQEGDIRFAAGYPNDGFLVLDDTEFGFIRKSIAPKVRLHVLNTASPEYAKEYQRFYTHLVRTFFGGELVTFSLAPSTVGLAVGTLPTLDITPLDRRVDRSRVLPEDRPPACPYEDRIVRHEEQGYQVDFTVTNPCRKNSVVAFRLNAGGHDESGSAMADGQGIAHFQINLRFGENVVNLLGLDNKEREIFKAVANKDDDIKSAAGNGSVELIGRNPLRREGDEVTVTHPASGRSWVVHVRNGEYRVQAPLGLGEQRFLVSRPGGGPPQVVTVNGGADCNENVTSEEQGGIIVVRITTTCRRGAVVTLRSGADSYRRSFDQDGRAEFKLPLKCGDNEIFYDSFDGSQRVVRAKGRCDLIKITLRWTADVDLDLRVQEQNAAPGEPGWIYYGNMNHDGMHGLGKLDIDDLGQHPGLKIENYDLEASRYPADSLPKYYVHYFTRGAMPQMPYCGNGNLARIEFEVIVERLGERRVIPGVIDSVPCGVALPTDSRISGKTGATAPPTLKPAQQTQVPVRAVPDSAVTTPGGAVEVAVLSNDTAPPGVAVAVPSQPSHGTVDISANGTIRYRPKSGFTGVDQFRYALGSGSVPAATAVVTVLVVRCPEQISDQRLERLSVEELYGCGRLSVARGQAINGRLWLGLADERGYPAAAREIGRLYDPGQRLEQREIPVDRAQAADYYRRAAAAGDAEAQALLEQLGQ